MLVFRKAAHEEGNALRVVDFIGESSGLAGLQPWLTDLLAEHQAEFLDMYCHGLPEADLQAAGFMPCPCEGPLLVPNYFEPLMRKNVEILFSYQSMQPNCRIFKGDGDQDRPNRIAG
jgi:hypothetical protein